MRAPAAGRRPAVSVPRLTVPATTTPTPATWNVSSMMNSAASSTWHHARRTPGTACCGPWTHDRHTMHLTVSFPKLLPIFQEA